MENEISLKIKDLVLPIIEEQDLDLVEFCFLHKAKKSIIKIIVDYPEGGISLNACALLNQKIDKAIEESNILGIDYILEVSSPGLDRPLKTQKDFLRAVGREVRFFLKEPVNEKKELTGEIKRVDKNLIFIEKNNKTTTINLEKINKAIQVII